jgi:hypothetical protein
MGSGFGPLEGTVTFPGYTWRAIEGTKEDPTLVGMPGTPVESCDLVLRVVGEGYGAFAGLTVVDPESGETVEIPVDERMVTGRLEAEPGNNGFVDEEPYSRLIAVPYEALRRFDWTRAERVKNAEDNLAAAERQVEEAKARLVAAEKGEAK